MKMLISLWEAEYFVSKHKKNDKMVIVRIILVTVIFIQSFLFLVIGNRD